MIADSIGLTKNLGAETPQRQRTPSAGPRYKKSFENFVVVPSNLQATETASRFAKGLVGFAVLVGPSGWGKTHILEASATQLDQSEPQTVMPAVDFAQLGQKQNPQSPLILDNVQDALLRTRTRIQLRLALERRVKMGRPTMLAITAPSLSRQLAGYLPAQHEWLISKIVPPAAAEREVVVRQLAADAKAELSDELVWVLAHKMRGNGRTLTGAVNRLKLADDDWTGASKTLKGCGLLKPFFADNSGWDLRVHIFEVAERNHPHLDLAFKRQLLIYTMLREAMVHEMDVAQFFEMEPARAYGSAIQFWEKLQHCEDSQILLRNFIVQAVDALKR